MRNEPESRPQHDVHALWDSRDLLTPAFRAGVRGEWVQVNVDDEAVAGAVLRIAHLDPTPDAFVTVPAGTPVGLDGFCSRWAGWRVETETPIPMLPGPDGERAPSLANIAVLRRPTDLPYDEWLHRWKVDHTPVGIADQGNTVYVQHRVLERLTDDTPEVAAIVEEHFPMAAIADFHAFYGSGGDEAELTARMTRMLTSVARFGADRDLDVVPTSCYRWALPG